MYADIINELKKKRKEMISGKKWDAGALRIHVWHKDVKKRRQVHTAIAVLFWKIHTSMSK